MKIQDSAGWAAVLWKAIYAGTENQIREDQDKTIAFLIGDEFYGGTTDEKFDKKKVAEARWEEMKYFEAMGVCKKVPHAQRIERIGRRHIGIKWVDVKKAYGRHRNRLVAKESKRRN